MCENKKLYEFYFFFLKQHIGPPRNVKAAYEFINEMFLENEKEVYSHQTCATSQNFFFVNLNYKNIFLFFRY